MNHQVNIRPGFFQKAFSIILAVFMSIGFAFGGALASSCEGGADCPVCAELPHRHVPGIPADMQSSTCTPDGPNSSCGFETSQEPGKFHSIVSSARSNHQSHVGIFTAVSDEYGQPLLPKTHMPQILLPDSGRATAIYLFNQSLLC
ncbi:MAG: hypothetical protein PVG35_05445 [Desulfobacterales bacterium]|jgi:hypothetical protein